MSAESENPGDAGSAVAPDTIDRIDADGSVPAARVYERLREIVDPCSAATGSNLNIVEMGLVKSVEVEDGHVDVEMRLTSPMCHMVPYFIEEVEGEVGDLDGVESVELETDHGFEWSEELMSEAAQRKRQALLDEHASRYREEQSDESAVSDA
ncbi:metal-sulfur cluster assembly factor [Halobellus rarus]|uniref:Metal-sulfur cluster assembly factor n=1 Tax=Halobellus rarus TaxID=1126237 RepID=A0ABD6CPB6_9EURY|nr:iron-sulfur cluster assembly protein [Halobellus rarus]